MPKGGVEEGTDGRGALPSDDRVAVRGATVQAAGLLRIQGFASGLQTAGALVGTST